MAKSEETRTLILSLKNGNTRKITIPANWKLTFGSVVPHSPGGHSNRDAGGVCLRFYEGNKENLRAVMTDVVSFRDATIDILERRTKIQRKAAQKQTSRGMKDVMVEARMTEWVDPDAEEDDDEDVSEFLRLPGGDDVE